MTIVVNVPVKVDQRQYYPKFIKSIMQIDEYVIIITCGSSNRDRVIE